MLSLKSSGAVSSLRLRLRRRSKVKGQSQASREGKGREGKGREGKGREGKGREGKGREGKGREGKGREGKGREGKGREGKGREGKGREGKGREGKGREGKGYLLWRFEIVLGVCTVGVYLLEVAAQLISETFYVRKGLCSFIVVLLWSYTPPLCAGALSLHWASSMSALHPSLSLCITCLTHCLCFGRRMLTRQPLNGCGLQNAAVSLKALAHALLTSRSSAHSSGLYECTIFPCNAMYTLPCNPLCIAPVLAWCSSGGHGLHVGSC